MLSNDSPEQRAANTSPLRPRLAMRGVTVTFAGQTGPRDWLRGRLWGPARTALAAVDLSVEGGETVAVVGTNGAGKSTLLRVALGLVEPGSGAVTRDGRVALGVGEPRSFYWRLSLIENLRFFAAVAGVDASPVPELLRAVGLEAHAGGPARQCSTGMFARLGLARALLLSPDLIALDELERGLDLEGVAHLRSVVSEYVSRRARAALVATHDLESAARADRVCWLEAGRVRALGPPEVVLPEARRAWGGGR